MLGETKACEDVLNRFTKLLFCISQYGINQNAKQ